jgi:uncharacterized phage infection (PIP) family protein YhgE
MMIMLNSTEKRSAISAVMMVLAVLVMGGIAKSEVASHLAQIIHIADWAGAIPLGK